MTKTIVFNTLGYEEAIDQSFMDEWEQTETEAEGGNPAEYVYDDDDDDDEWYPDDECYPDDE